MSVKLSGLPQARAAFQALPEAIRLRVRDALSRAAFRVVQRAKPLVPVRFGYLRDAISYRMASTGGVAIVGVKRERIVRPGIYQKGRRKGQQYNPFLPTMYAHFAHDGTPRSKGVPFMFIAANAERTDLVREIGDAMKDVGRDVANVGGGLE